MIQLAEIERMSLAERLHTMEMLWATMARQPEDVASPEWHEKIVKSRLDRINRGETEFLTLDQAKKHLLDTSE